MNSDKRQAAIDALERILMAKEPGPGPGPDPGPTDIDIELDPDLLEPNETTPPNGQEVNIDDPDDILGKMKQNNPTQVDGEPEEGEWKDDNKIEGSSGLEDPSADYANGWNAIMDAYNNGEISDADLDRLINELNSGANSIL